MKQAEYVNVFVEAVHKEYAPLAKSYGWVLKRIREDEFVVKSQYCSMHIRLYFGHETNIVVYFAPCHEIKGRLGHELIGICRVVPKHTCGANVITKLDQIATCVHQYAKALNEICVKLMCGDINEWLRFKPDLDKADEEALANLESSRRKAEEKFKRVYGSKSPWGKHSGTE